jgi:hypothetical protein
MFTFSKFTNTIGLQEGIEFRRRFILSKMYKYYSEEEVAQVKTNRRSDSTDEAVINDFMSFELPEHKIPRDQHFYDAVDKVRRDYQPLRKVHPVSYPDTRYYSWHLKPSAEAPWNLDKFIFTPIGRNLDQESEVPKLGSDQIPIPENLIGQRILVSDYLKQKQSAGLIQNTLKTFHNLYNEIYQYNRGLVHMIKNGMPKFWTKDGTPIPYYWNTLHARAHVVSEDEEDKIRAVFGAPKLLVQVELMFLWPLQAAYLNSDVGRLLWGREIMKGGWKKLTREIYSDKKPNSFIGVDWSQWDKRLSFELIDVVHEIWRSYFDFSQYEPTSFYPNAKPSHGSKSIENLWEWMCYSIKHTPIALPNGTLWKWNYSGFGSGYFQTQLMDSFGDDIVILTILSALGININGKGFWRRVQGDDSLICLLQMVARIYGPTFLTMMAEAALYYFNHKLNVKKSMISERLSGMTILGYFNAYGMPKRTDEDLLRHLLFPEHPQDMGRTGATAIGLLHASCGCSERFYRLCIEIFESVLQMEGVDIRWDALSWMVRSGWIETVEQIRDSPIPSLHELIAKCKTYEPRSFEMEQRTWPTEEGSKGRFYFINEIKERDEKDN